MREEELAGVFTNGNINPFKIILTRFYPAMCFFADKMMHNFQVSERIVTSAFEVLWKRHDRYHSMNNIKSFLYITIRNAREMNTTPAEANSLLKNAFGTVGRSVT